MTNKLSVTFLGTGTSQGIPIIGSTHPVCLSSNEKDKRLRVSVLLSWKEFNYVIDCGPDFRQQMLRQHVNRLDGILYTHEHSDHTAGLDDIRPYFFRQGNIPLFAHSRVVASLKKRFDYIFEEKNKYPGAPTVDINLVKNNEPFSIGDTLVTPINVMHNKVQVFGYRVGDFTYLTDVKTIAPEELEKIKYDPICCSNWQY